jgi:hypothetical protein
MQNVWGWILVERRVNGESAGGWTWSSYFVYLYENRIMKPVEIILRRRPGGRGRFMEGMKVTKVHCEQICKCHDETPRETNIC